MFLMYLAILPAAVLLYFIYKADKIEKEPTDLLVKIFLFGVLSTLSAYFLEVIGGGILDLFFYEDEMIYMIIENFLIVALAEEAGKYVVVKKVAWKHPAFNYTFDAVVYAVFSSLGFAALENIVYISNGGLSTAIMRAFLSVPGHAIDAVFMGCYFGAAKKCEILGDKNGKDRNLALALIIPVCIHGFYDFVLSVAEYYPIVMVAFFIFEIGITAYAIIKVLKLSKADTALVPQAAMNFDPMTGQPLQPIAPVQGFVPQQPVVAPMTPVQPVVPPVTPVQPAMNFDPMTGQRLTPVQQPAMNFDPMTGQPLHPNAPVQDFVQTQPVVEPVMPVQPQPIVEPVIPVQPVTQQTVEVFVPVQPIQYDPVTGQPVDPVFSPEA
ncbi:PrsW family glutamic-type intramembrane protease [Butyrivibrio sp. VCB2006]|uniref:PrsW family glutamic-type intramembrane protease n=1 Tax=Butyrivibrio sp. VCB2006 TaxID=1280679 RepID=UPI0003FACDFD|nr:PrsW family glutamic-type intramembrane protease [Butyrivibrio sp. VCB2006]